MKKTSLIYIALSLATVAVTGNARAQDTGNSDGAMNASVTGIEFMAHWNLRSLVQIFSGRYDSLKACQKAIQDQIDLMFSPRMHEYPQDDSIQGTCSSATSGEIVLVGKCPPTSDQFNPASCNKTLVWKPFQKATAPQPE